MDSPSPICLLDRVRNKIRLKHYSLRTEQTYVDWIKRFILFHGKRHPSELGAEEVEAFLTHLAVAGQVAASTQNQAKSALLFLYQVVLEVELPWLDQVEKAKTPTAAAFPWTPRCASRPQTGRGWSDCCVTAPARRSPWNGCSNGMPSTCSTKPANRVLAAVARRS